MLALVRTDRAETDLAEILDYLEERSPPAAERLAAAIDERCSRLCQFPLLGRSRAELGAGTRSVAIDQYVRFYRVTTTALEILRILHGARDVETIMKTEDG